MDKTKTPYIKPTRYMHDSGFRTFEVGYITKMSDKNTVLEKIVLCSCSDHIYQDYGILVGNSTFCLNMDLTRDGYIRFFVHGNIVVWDSEKFALSSMGLKIAGDL